MNHIDKVRVEGFWGQYDFELKLNKGPTFLIGENGTGKTTLINLIAATLSADYQMLDKLPFHRCELVLRTRGSNKKPRIIVNKRRDVSTGLEVIDYSIQKATTHSPIQFTLNDIEEQRRLRRQPVWTYGLLSSGARSPQKSSDLSAALRDLVSLSWLSIHRSNLADSTEVRIPERAYDSSVDLKINELNQRLSRYIAVLNSQKTGSVGEFQEFVFSSLVRDREQTKAFELGRTADLDAMRSTLNEAFDSVSQKPTTFRKESNRFFARMTTLQEQMKKGKSNLSLVEFGKLVGLEQIQEISNKWSVEKGRQDELYKDLTLFVDTMNQLLVNKRVFISKSAELSVQTNSGASTPLEMSSGEKQVLILLGETLLQQHAPYVYIADEPELSLHLRWQERIIGDMAKLNENAQIIVATHSPDIVSTFKQNVIRMESLLRA